MEAKKKSTSQPSTASQIPTTEKKEPRIVGQPPKVKKKIVSNRLVEEGGSKKNVSRRLFNEEGEEEETSSIRSVQFQTKQNVPDSLELGNVNECLSKSKEAKSTETSQVIDIDHTAYARLNTKRHVCEYCQKTFKSNGKLNSHIYSHTGERPFECTKCTKAFSSKFKLVRHLLIHSKVRKFICHICDRTFLRNDHLKNHIKIHDPLKRIYACDRNACDKKYSSLLSYKKHLAVHLVDDGVLTCLLCNQKFETKDDIQLHLKCHSGSRLFKTQKDKKFKCQFCDRLFLTRKDVARHLVVHTGNRDFLCQFCPQRFGRKDHLVRHIKKTHNGEKKRVRVYVKSANTEKTSEDVKAPPAVADNVSNIYIIPNNSIIFVKNEKNEINFETPVLVTNESVESESCVLRSNTKIKTEATCVFPKELIETESNDLTDNMKDIFDSCDDLLLSSNDFVDGNLGVDENIDMRGEHLLEHPSGGGEILRNLLLSNDDVLSTPLPGFNQIFNSSAPN